MSYPVLLCGHASIGASSHGESHLRMLRVVRRGDRHDARDLTVACRFEGDFAGAFVDGRSAGLLPGEALKSLVHAVRPAACGRRDRALRAGALRRAARWPSAAHARTRRRDRAPWNRLEVAGKPQGQAFLAGTPERRTAAITSNGRQVAVVSGIEQLTIMRDVGACATPPARPETRPIRAASTTGCSGCWSRHSRPAGAIRAPT